MSNKLIDLNALSSYKTQSDLKYQDKLTAGDSISISNNVISVEPTLGSALSGNVSVPNNSIYEIGDITLLPGNYIISFTCTFASNSSGYRQCGFSTSTTNMDGFGSAYWDCQKAANGALTQTRVSAIFQVSATTYPNGRKFYFLAKKSVGNSISCYPRAYYLKF